MASTTTITETPAAEPTEPTATPATPATESQRPDWLPEKFKSPQDLASAYASLEKKLGTPETTPTTPDAPANVDLAQYETEYVEHGNLSEESYAALAAAGHTKESVDSVIAGRVAQAQLATEAVYKSVGGEQTYNSMTAWAVGGLTDAQKAAYNASVSSGNSAQAALAVSGLKAMYDKAMGSEGTLVGGRASTPVESFRSADEMTRAMSDPRYRSDPAYMQDVVNKLANSDFIR